jgi:hypothetical protein
MTWTPIVGKKFTVEEFRQYVSSLDLVHAPFKPLFVVHHNTSSPSRAQYDAYAHRSPPITDEQWLQNLAGYYQGLGWQAGPHLFIVPSGICVFTPLTHRGTHTPSWNWCSWGIEMVGDYDTEPFKTDIGDNAVIASAILHAAAHLSPLPFQLGRRGLHFHKEDPATTHRDCPGKNVIKADFVEAVMTAMQAVSGQGHPPDRDKAISGGEGKAAAVVA